MDNSERRGTPRAVLLNIRNYVRLAVLNPSFFESLGRNPNKKAPTASVLGRSVRSSKPLAKQRADDTASACC